MKGIKTWLRRMADYSRASIRRQVLFLVLVAFFTSGALADRLVRPIRALAEGVQEIAEGNLDKKLEIRTGNELEELARAVAEANDALVQSNTAFMFVTAFIGILHLPTGNFTYVNAGHNPPLLCRKGRTEYLPKARNPILGVRGGMAFAAENLTLQRGDSLFLYTDGVTEARDGAKGFFGEQRLQEAVSSTAGQGAGVQMEAVRERLAAVYHHLLLGGRIGKCIGKE